MRKRYYLSTSRVSPTHNLLFIIKFSVVLICIFSFNSLAARSLKDHENLSTLNAVLPITGKVIDETRQPLIGVTIQEKGTNNRTQTRVDGSFSITVANEKSILVFSYIGYNPLELPAPSITNTIQMTAVANVMEDVIIVGYGTQKKQSVLGAISQVDATVLQRAGGVSNIGAALTGNIPGITTIQSTGAPGLEDLTITIRGQSTWNNSSPLVLVDGIERSMAGLDIQSVQTISVLKDASATAVFG